MLRSNSKSLRNHEVSPKEEKERLQFKGVAEKEGFNPGMKAWNYYISSTATFLPRLPIKKKR